MSTIFIKDLCFNKFGDNSKTRLLISTTPDKSNKYSIQYQYWVDKVTYSIFNITNIGTLEKSTNEGSIGYYYIR